MTTEIYGRVKVVIGPRSWDRKLQQEVTVDGVPEWRDAPVEVVPAGPGPELESLETGEADAIEPPRA